MYQKYLKRILDLALLLVVGTVLSIVGVVIAVMIRVNSGSPVFFRQERVGMNGEIFEILKFRTMRNDSEAEKTFSLGATDRVTKIGKFLRQTKLDEIPQLYNVLKGDMSLVGPRPEIKRWTQVRTNDWDIVHTVRPGITDKASIEYRDEEKYLSEASDPKYMYENEILPGKLAMNIDYVRNISFKEDILILIQTVKTVLVKNQCRPKSSGIV